MAENEAIQLLEGEDLVAVTKLTGDRYLWKPVEREDYGGGLIHFWKPNDGGQEDESGEITGQVGEIVHTSGPDKEGSGDLSQGTGVASAGDISDSGLTEEVEQAEDLSAADDGVSEGQPEEKDDIGDSGLTEEGQQAEDLSAADDGVLEGQPEEKNEEESDQGDQPPLQVNGGKEIPEWVILFARAVNMYRMGAAGDREAVKEAYELLEKVRSLVPESNLAEAYYGGVTSLLGRDAADPAEKFNKSIKGLKILDRCVAKEPDNAEIRFLRANVCYRLPEKYFHRTDTALDDFTYLVTRYDSNPDVFSKDLYCESLFKLGVSLKRTNRNREAESAWRKLLSVTNDAKYVALLKQEGFQPDDDGVTSSAEVRVPADKEMIEEGIKLHRLALQGDKESGKKAFDFFEKILQEYPDDPLVKAYYADCMSLMALDPANLMEMFSMPPRAKKIFDSAVSSDPKNIKIRYMRAYHFFRLPEAFFRRTTTAIADFEYLIQRYESDNSVFSEESYWQLLYDLGVAYRRLEFSEEALSAWKKLVSLKPDSKYEAMIEKELDNDFVGFHLHELAVAGNRAAAKMSLELWREVFEKNPEDTVAQAYYGSSLALVGRESPDLGELLGNTIRGLKYLKRAVERDPNNPQVRALRAYTAYSLPEVVFRQSKRAVEDFEFLKEAFQQDNSIFSRDYYQKILYDLGVAYQRTGSGDMAEKVWSELLEEDTDLKYKELVSQRMDTGKQS